MKASILFCIILILYIDSYGQLRFEKDLPFYSQLNVFDIKSPKSKYLIGENAGLFLSAGFEYNGWIPYMSDYLNYTTEGFKILYVNGGLNHNVNWLPALQFKWETNFGAQHQDEILQVQNSKTQLEQGYDLFKGFLKFAEEDKDRDIYKFELRCTKETFYTAVSPTMSGLSYYGFNNPNPVNIDKNSVLSHYTKFQEIDALFFTDGWSIIPSLVNALLSGSGGDAIELSGVDTRLGGFFSTYHKPYMVQQLLTSGTVNGNENEIYNARFNTFGLIEQYRSNPENNFVFTYSPRFGLSFIKLNESTRLSDTESPLFFYYGHEFEMGFRIKFGEKVKLNISGNADLSFMLGGNIFTNDSTKQAQIETKSFINSDFLFKIKALLEIR